MASFCAKVINSSRANSGRVYHAISGLSKALLPATPNVVIRGRVQTSRKMGKGGVFIVLRQTPYTVQCVMSIDDAGITEENVGWVAAVPSESVVEVEGVIVEPEKLVTGATQQDIEIKISNVFLISKSKPKLPFTIADASRKASKEEEEAADEANKPAAPEPEVERTPEMTDGQYKKAVKDREKRIKAASRQAKPKLATVGQGQRLNTRWLDTRTTANNAIFRIQSRICQYFREFLNGNDFVEIHTPKLIAGASEGGAAGFGVGYYNKEGEKPNASLAQSPQLYKQMALMGDLHRVFEVGPVFRAENSFTHRHLSEFTGLDMEMEINEHYYEVLDVAEGLFAHMFRMLAENDNKLVEAVRSQHDHEPFVYEMTQETVEKYKLGCISANTNSEDAYGGKYFGEDRRVLRLSYPQAVKLLNTEGLPGYRANPPATTPNGEEWKDMEETDDLKTHYEKLLGDVVKARYGVDFFICDRFPLAVRPFYTMPDPEDDTWSNSYDMFMRGEEISSGAQRIHDPEMLIERAKKWDVSRESLGGYVDSFELGAHPHGGFGLGLERICMLYLGLHNVRKVSLYPRDPRRIAP